MTPMTKIVSKRRQLEEENALLREKIALLEQSYKQDTQLIKAMTPAVSNKVYPDVKVTDRIVATNIEPATDAQIQAGSYDVLRKYAQHIKLVPSFGGNAFILHSDMKLPPEEFWALNQHHSRNGIWIYGKRAFGYKVYVMKNNKPILDKIAQCGIEIPSTQV